MANLKSCDSHDSVVVYEDRKGGYSSSCPLCEALKEIEDLEAALKAEKDRE